MSCDGSPICTVARLANPGALQAIAESLGDVLNTSNTALPRTVVTPDKLPARHPLLLALSVVEARLAQKELHMIAASLFVDYGRGVSSPYHSDIWFAAPFMNRVLQLWLPVVACGETSEIQCSMLRVDRKNRLARDWGVPYGVPEYCHLYSGERRRLLFPTESGRLSSDPAGIRNELMGGDAIGPGDVLCFESSFCHYSLPSRALRAALSVRFTWGQPRYSGYFLEPRPLDGMTTTEATRLAQADACRGLRSGDLIPLPRLRRRGSFHEYPQDPGESEFAEILLDALKVLF
jgi:hypothetical protein